MNYYLIFFLIILFLFIGRVSFIFAIKRDSNAHNKIRKLLTLHNLYLLNPLVSKKTYTKYILSLTLSVLAALFFFVIINNLNIYNLANLTYFLHIVFLFISISLLLYLAIYDLLYYEIPVVPLFSFLTVVITFNVIVAVVSVLTQDKIFLLGNPVNLLSGIGLGLIFYIVVKLTKEQGMGMGDVYLMLSIGLALGISRSITAYLVTLMLASIVGIVISLFKRKFHNTLIPLVPFIFLGFCVALSTSDSILNLFRIF